LSSLSINKLCSVRTLTLNIGTLAFAYLSISLEPATMVFALTATRLTGPSSTDILMLILAVILKPAAQLPAMPFVSVAVPFPGRADVNLL
jgi:hypothetical protein